MMQRFPLALTISLQVVVLLTIEMRHFLVKCQKCAKLAQGWRREAYF